MNKNSENISVWKRFMKSMTKAHDLGTEEDIMLDHDYDGIKELDNVLPPWWLYGFYITIVISGIYIYNVFTNPEEYSQAEEFAIEVEQGKADVEAYKAELLGLKKSKLDYVVEQSTDDLSLLSDIIVNSNSAESKQPYVSSITTL